MAVNLGWISFGLNPDTSRLDRARRDIRAFGSEVDATSQRIANSMARLSNVASLISGPLGGVAARFQTIASLSGRFGVFTAGAVAGAAAVGFGFIKLGEAAIDATRQLQKLEMGLGAVSGGFALTARQLDYVKSVADRSGKSITDIGQAWIRLQAAAQGTSLEGDRIRKVFEQITMVGARLGLSSDEVAGTLKAVEQIMSKGTVQAEELRGQLGDRLPGAFNIMAKALGVTTEELNKLMKQGKITADALVPFADTLAQKYGTEIPQSMNQTAMAEARLGNQWTVSASNLDKLIGFSDAYAFTLKLTTGLLEKLNWVMNPYRLAIRESGKAIEVNAKALREAGDATYSFRRELQAQITLQQKAARAALTEASAQLAAAKAKQSALDKDFAITAQNDDILGSMWVALQGGINGQQAEDAQKKVDAYTIQLKALDNQLQDINNMMKQLDSESPSTKPLDPLGGAGGLSESKLAKIAKALREAGQSIEKVRTEYDLLGQSPAQRELADRMAEVAQKTQDFKDKLVDAGVPLSMITEKTNAYNAALTALAQKQYELEFLPNFWTSMAQTFSGTLQSASDQLIDTWIEGGDTLAALADIGKMVVSTLIKEFATLAVVNPLKNLISDIFGGGSLMPTFNPLSFLGLGGGSSGLSSWTDPTASAMGHFASGGSFKIPGGGSGRGMDSQLVSFWGKPGETVDIGKSGHGGGKGETYYEGNTYYLDAKNAGPGVEQMIIDAIKRYDSSAVVRLQRDTIKARNYRKPGIN